MEMSEKLENNLWSSIAELETVTPDVNPSLILKLLLYTDPTVFYRLIFPTETLTHIHTHTRNIYTLSNKQKNILAPIHPSPCLKHDVSVAKNGGVQILNKNV